MPEDGTSLSKAYPHQSRRPYHINRSLGHHPTGSETHEQNDEQNDDRKDAKK